jgi:hypothetical protein
MTTVTKLALEQFLKKNSSQEFNYDLADHAADLCVQVQRNQTSAA